MDASTLREALRAFLTSNAQAYVLADYPKEMPDHRALRDKTRPLRNCRVVSQQMGRRERRRRAGPLVRVSGPMCAANGGRYAPLPSPHGLMWHEHLGVSAGDACAIS